MLKRIRLITILLLFSTDAAFSQTDDVCAKIIDHGLNNISLKTTVNSLADRLYWRFCDEKYESMSESKKAEFGATIESIPMNLGAEGSSASEKFAKFCGMLVSMRN